MAEAEILAALDEMLRYCIITDSIYLLMALALIAIAVLLYKRMVCCSRKKRLLSCMGLTTLAAATMVLAIVDFLPAYKDHRQQAYIIETEAEIYVGGSTYVAIDSYCPVTITTSSGETVELKLTDFSKVSCESSYSGTFVYTQYSKELICFQLDNTGQ